MALEQGITEKGELSCARVRHTISEVQDGEDACGVGTPGVKINLVVLVPSQHHLHWHVPWLPTAVFRKLQ